MKVELILSIVLAVSTVCYTIINLMMWFESRATRKQKLESRIIAYLKYSDDNMALRLVIENIGEGCAKNLKIFTNPDYNRFIRYPLSECNPIKNGINALPSKEQIIINLNFSSKTDLNNDSFNLRVEYSDMTNNKRKTNEYYLPFNLVGTPYITPPVTFMGQIPYYLKEIDKTLKKFQEK